MNKRLKNLFIHIRNKCFQPFFRKMCGWEQLEDRLNAIEYIINQGFDITSFPVATGNLRKCQTAGAELLRIVCRTLDENNLKYWLDYGTLLGAVRHKGYIPWDDDLDIAMTRDEYNIACEILPDKLKKYGIVVTEPNDERIGITIWEAGLIMDIFPVDNVNENSVDSYDQLKNKINEYKSYYVKHKKKLSANEMHEKKGKIIGTPSPDNRLWFHSPEFCGNRAIYTDDIIFPLKELSFEGYMFKIPNDYHIYLTQTYGDYMAMPKGGVLHHQGGNGDKGITYNIEKYNTDIDQVIEKLKSY